MLAPLFYGIIGVWQIESEVEERNLKKSSVRTSFLVVFGAKFWRF